MTSARSHVLLGGNGVAGRETATALRDKGERVISVGRKPSAVDGVQSRIADLLAARDVADAMAGAAVAYLVAGLPYVARIWAAQWPVIVGNAIDAAIQHGTHLVYLDNVYAYGPADQPMTERTPINATSKKGRVRAAALRLLESACEERGLVCTIGRSADFYGPGAATGMFNMFVVDPVAAGKDARWLCDADQPHSLTYTPDLGKALAILGTEPSASGRVWHLPTAPALTARQWVELAGGPTTPVKVMTRPLLGFGALFNTAARESLELAYQYEAPYLFDSSAFEGALQLTATSPAEGIEAALGAARRTP